MLVGLSLNSILLMLNSLVGRVVASHKRFEDWIPPLCCWKSAHLETLKAIWVEISLLPTPHAKTCWVCYVTGIIITIPDILCDFWKKSLWNINYEYCQTSFILPVFMSPLNGRTTTRPFLVLSLVSLCIVQYFL